MVINMDLIKYAILGLIQGITEPIPLSSSGHLLIFKNLFNTTMFNDLSFEIIANFGSFIAILIIFWPDILILIKHFFKYFFDKKKSKNYYPNFKYVTLLIVSTLPAGIIGLLFKNKIESLISVKLVGISLIITGIALLFVKKMNGNKKAQDLTYTHVLLIGFFQMFARLPGLSRSGMVMCGCLLCGLSNSEALKYTFMLYFLVLFGAMLSLNNAFNVG